MACVATCFWGPGPGGRPQNTQHSAYASQTLDPSPGAAASHVFCLHLDPEPVAEADATGAVPCGTHTPDQGEDEPGLDQLWDATQLFGRYFLEALGTEAGTELSGLRKPGGGGHPLASAIVLRLQQTGRGVP